MNINVILGTLSFVLWSIFSTWYYVNFIRNLNPEQPIQEITLPITSPNPKSDTDTTAKSTPIAKAVLAPIQLNWEFQFEKNTSDLIDPKLINRALDSLSNKTSQNLMIKITGYTCNLGSEKYNMTLAQKRAEKVQTLLKESNLTIGDLQLEAKGEAEPKFPNTNDHNREMNRRVTLSIKSIK